MLYGELPTSMDILKISYSGRVTAGNLKELDLAEYTPPPELTEDQRWMGALLHEHGLETILEHRDALDLPNLSNLHGDASAPPLRQRGSLGITSHGRDLVRSAAQYLQDTHGARNLSFLTLTIPPECLLPSLVQDWSNTSRKLRQRLQRLLQSRGLSGELVAVVEIQEKRGKSESGLPPLHWHFVFHGRMKNGAWAVTPAEYRELWLDLLHSVTGVRSEAHASCDVNRVHKSAAGYLGKYMSKGSKSCSQYDIEVLPASWYMCTSVLRKTVKKLEVYLTGKTAQRLFDFLVDNKDYLAFSKFVTITTNDGRLVPVGWYGETRDRSQYYELLQMCYDLRDVDLD